MGSMKGFKLPLRKNTKPVESQTRHGQGSPQRAEWEQYREKLYGAIEANFRKNLSDSK
jgi:hypothetical protein